MPTFVVLATRDVGLAEAWARQVPENRIALNLARETLPQRLAPGVFAVVVLDATAEALLPEGLAACPAVYVGEPRSTPFEQAKLEGRAKAYLSYEDSRTRLADVLPLVAEIAEKQAMLDILAERSPPASARHGQAPEASAPNESVEWWHFMENALEVFQNRDGLVGAFRSAAKQVLRASHAVFFLRGADGFHADVGTSFLPVKDPMVAYLEAHPVVVDGINWSAPADPLGELSIRNCLTFWGARLIVPVHDNGHLLGLIALGVREDGRSYDEGDKSRAVSFARLLKHFLVKSEQLGRLSAAAEVAVLGRKYLPRTLVLRADENAPRDAPLVVREALGKVKHSGSSCRVAPSEGQPLRVSAGPIPETGGVWAFWEEASTEVGEALESQRAVRREVLRELGLTLSHELGNGLVSLSLLHRVEPGRPPPRSLLEAARADIAKLETLNMDVGQIQRLYEAQAEPTDIRSLVLEVGVQLGLKIDAGTEPVQMSVARDMIELALQSLVSSVCENRPQSGMRAIALQLRFVGEGRALTALLSIRGRHLELEGVLPVPTASSVPNQGRFRVFLAKEVLRIHHGEIHAGPGMEGTEILFSFRSL